jgi:purine catabolism regulator
MAGIMTTRKNRTVLFVQMPVRKKEQAGKALRKLVEDIAGTLRRAPDIRQVMLGYSSRFVPLEKAREQYDRARRALVAGRIMKGACHDYEELGVFKLLGRAAPQDTMEEMLPAGLQKLIGHDKKHKGSLVQTLDAYFVSNRNAREAARLLFIHSKTMLYRLNRIAEVADLDYKDHGQMLEMELALQLLHLAGETGKWKKGR